MTMQMAAISTEPEAQHAGWLLHQYSAYVSQLQQLLRFSSHPSVQVMNQLKRHKLPRCPLAPPLPQPTPPPPLGGGGICSHRRACNSKCGAYPRRFAGSFCLMRCPATLLLEYHRPLPDSWHSIIDSLLVAVD